MEVYNIVPYNVTYLKPPKLSCNRERKQKLYHGYWWYTGNVHARGEVNEDIYTICEKNSKQPAHTYREGKE
jgi:hypothetical protein